MAFAASSAATVLVLLGVIANVVTAARFLVAAFARRLRRDSLASTDVEPLRFLAPRGRGESVLRHTLQQALPAVSVVLPVKLSAIKASSPKENWLSQLLTMYGGPVEFVFCVESAEDGAVELVRQLDETRLRGEVSIRLCVTGRCSTCSQKVHNMLRGADACSAASRYILFLDANCQIHPGTLLTFVSELEQDAEAAVATGYPLDLPLPGASLWSFLVCSFRHAALAEYTHDRCPHVWGGAMLLRAQEFRDDSYRIRSRWLDGGYSDDMILEACVLEHGKTIATPVQAVFVNVVSQYDFAGAWGFLRRQTFVMRTYISRAMLLRQALLFLLYAVVNGLQALGFYAAVGVLVSSVLAGALPRVALNCQLALAYALLLLAAAFASRAHIHSTARMCAALSPEKAPVDLAHVSIAKLACAMLLQSALAPAVALATLRRPWINWAGINYHVANGRVCSIRHPDGIKLCAGAGASGSAAAPNPANGELELEQLPGSSGSAATVHPKDTATPFLDAQGSVRASC
eukprot:TRINITY_DN55255_c0_g1_i1.p1 TRINITY_DN55255_c0_g1~~TRINITY_DN55255_c0_g1_i1.p1  ORF type:complete len:518 (-),score=129.75 TRINITY_DN55255_c0_g1_i1:217-1770(-)